MKTGNIQYRKFLKTIDWGIVIATILLMVIGILSIASATRGTLNFIEIQFLAFVLGTIAIIFVLCINYNSLGNMYKIIYVINIILLIAVLILGTKVNGSKSWFNLGPLKFQPAEIVKLGLILTFAKHLENVKDNLNTFKGIITSLIHIGIPIGLIMLQPDFGTSMVFIFICIIMLFSAGLNNKLIFGTIAAFLISIPTAWFLFLKTYQRDRIMVFFYPDLDAYGAGYHVSKSKMAIGSGQFWGKGLFNGTLHNLGFIPARHTDFIFTVTGEEFGFIGTLLLLLLFMWLLLRCINIAKMSKDDYGMLICVGITAMFLFHIFENIGMTIGIMPVTGIPLPFISYGGSALLTNMIAIGLVLNVGMRRRVIQF